MLIHAMHAFDRTLQQWIGQFAHRWPYLDAAVSTLIGLDLLKGGAFMAILAWCWFAKGERRLHRREVVLATFVAAIASIAAGRALATLLPYRTRPVHDSASGVVIPYFMPEELLRGWSSFPSDHAMLYATLATGLVFVSPWLGLLANLYVLVLIDAPRVFVGWHYPTDILGGLVLGVAFGLVGNLGPIRRRIARPFLSWSEARPASFYAVACLVAIQLGTMFKDARSVLHVGSTAAKIAWCRISPHPGCTELGGGALSTGAAGGTAPRAGP